MERDQPLRASRHVAMLCCLLAISAPAHAAEVSGTITVDNARFSGTLRLPDGSAAPVDGNGKYDVLVPAGPCPTVFVDSRGRKFNLTIQGSTTDVIQDISLNSSSAIP
jgi:hypothetical protein